jgi:transcriptional regulator with XRE-family HTH domain
MNADLPTNEVHPGPKIRAFRLGKEWSLDDMADRIKEQGCDRPSAAKLSRIETRVQPVTLDILPALSKITEIPRGELRPDLVTALHEAAE